MSGTKLREHNSRDDTHEAEEGTRWLSGGLLGLVLSCLFGLPFEWSVVLWGNFHLDSPLGHGGGIPPGVQREHAHTVSHQSASAHYAW